MRQRPQSPPTPSVEISAALLARLDTLTEPGALAGDRITRIEPAHRRLARRRAISPEAETAVTVLCDRLLLAETGYRDPRLCGGGGNIVTAQMLAADAVRRFEADFGRGAVLLVLLACIECWRPARVAQRLLGFRAPRNPAYPSESWHDEGRRVLDRVLVPLFEEVAARNGVDTTRRRVADVPPSPELGDVPRVAA